LASFQQEDSVKARFAASAVVMALVLGGTTGCTFLTPQATTEHYDPSDGIGASIGEIQVRNVLLLTEDGETASLLINLINDSQYGADVTVQYADASNAKVNESVYVNAGDVTSLGGPDNEQLVLSGIDAKPGSLFPVFIQYGNETGKQLWVPVLDGGEPHYSELIPESTSTE